MPFEKLPQSYTKCPKCQKHSCTVLESRINKDNTRRRRKVCTECDHRHTVYEVSEEFYKNAVLHQRLIDHFIDNLNLEMSPTSQNALSLITCDNCVHMRPSGCSFDFPDAGGSFASDCSMFEPDRA
jgi:protein-arginine kinase activator protein McsA